MLKAVPLTGSEVEPPLELTDGFELLFVRCRPLPCRLDSFENDDDLLPSFAGGVSTSPIHLMRTSTRPPAGVNLTLLLTRLMMTWRMRCWSPHRHISFNLPVPCGPRAGSLLSVLVLSGLLLSSIASEPRKLTVKVIRPSLTCLSKMVKIWDLMSASRNSFSSRFSCCPIWFLEKLRRSSSKWSSKSPKSG